MVTKERRLELYRASASLAAVVLAVSRPRPVSSAPDPNSESAVHLYVPVAIRYDPQDLDHAPCIERHELDEGDDGTIETLALRHYWDDVTYRTLVYVGGDVGPLSEVIHSRLDRWRLLRTYSRDRGADGVPDSRVTSKLNASGRLLNERYDVDADGTVDWARFYAYDIRGLLVWEAGEENGDGKIDYTQEYTYDSRDRIVRVWFTWLDSGVDNELTTFVWVEPEPRVEVAYIDRGADGFVDEVRRRVTNESGDVIREQRDGNGDGLFDDDTVIDYDAFRRVARRRYYEDGHLHVDELFDYDDLGRVRRREVVSLSGTMEERWSRSCAWQDR